MNYLHLQIDQPATYVCRITLNRPRQFNALNRLLLQELQHSLMQFENSTDDFLIITGTGRAFCFGADFSEFENREELPELLDLFQTFISKLYDSSKITVASLNGFATGAGLDVALACDFRFVADNIKLGEAYISMGLVPDGGGSYFLPRIVGSARALEMLMTGEAITAEEAKQIGLVHRVCPSMELQDSTISFVKQLASKSKTAREQIKRLLKNPTIDLVHALARERDAQLICFEDQTHQRLAAEFLQKRRKQ